MPTKIANRSARLYVLPPQTVYPPEAKLIRPPGTQVSVWMLPDGQTEAMPVRHYPALQLPPGVTEIDPAVHDDAYFELIQGKSKLAFATDLEFVTSAKQIEQVKAAFKIVDHAEEAALAFVEIEADGKLLRRWAREEAAKKPARPKVQDAIKARIKALEE